MKKTPRKAATRASPVNDFNTMPFTSLYDSTCNIDTVCMVDPNESHFYLPISLQGSRTNKIFTAAMVDSGATALFIDRKFVTDNWIPTFPLKKSIKVRNIDGTENTAGRIERCARMKMEIEGYEEWTDFLVTDIGSESVILGLPWLKKLNPRIDWKRGKLQIPEDQEEIHEATVEEEEEEKSAPIKFNANRKLRRHWKREGVIEDLGEEVWCAAGYTYSQQIAEAENARKAKRSFEQTVPPEYQDFRKVFSEEESERLPNRQPWDHAIELTPDAPATIRTKVYPMSVSEQQELERFLEENLRKGYIQPSKSPIASPVFFIKKKDGKLRFIQDYRKLNEFTVRNRYPLPLVQDIISKLQEARVFTKFDVRWGYNNVRIRKGDEWKAAFATNRGLFEPNVMFFGLTNSPATFQALMDTIFADLIAAGKVAVYLDDILIFTKNLKEHR